MAGELVLSTQDKKLSKTRGKKERRKMRRPEYDWELQESKELLTRLRGKVSAKYYL